jgi:hypothetical protein
MYYEEGTHLFNKGKAWLGAFAYGALFLLIGLVF